MAACETEMSGRQRGTPLVNNDGTFSDSSCDTEEGRRR